MSGTCLIINLLFLIFASIFAHVSEGTGTLFKGDCTKARTLDVGIHMVINCLATGLVGASNYTMQCLAAPSRSEVDQAHSQGIWLDIGVPSARNLRYISLRRSILWAALVASTVPVHLMWNSVIFSTLQNNTFMVVGASRNILQDSQYRCKNGSFDVAYPVTLSSDVPSGFDYSDVVCELFNHSRGPAETSTPLARLEARECIEQYASEIQSKWLNVVVVVNDVDLDSRCELRPIPSNMTQLFAFLTSGVFWQNGEECIDQSNLDSTVAHTDHPFVTNWAKSQTTWSHLTQVTLSPQYPIEYCLAMEGSKSCRLGFSLPILLVMIVCNAVKVFAIMCTFKVIKEEHLVTLGDAISSFLQIPDKTTAGHCLKAIRFFQRRSFRSGQESPRSRVYRIKDTITGNRIPLYWFQSASFGYWAFVLVL